MFLCAINDIKIKPSTNTPNYYVILLSDALRLLLFDVRFVIKRTFI